MFVSSTFVQKLIEAFYLDQKLLGVTFFPFKRLLVEYRSGHSTQMQKVLFLTHTAALHEILVCADLGPANGAGMAPCFSFVHKSLNRLIRVSSLMPQTVLIIEF